MTIFAGSANKARPLLDGHLPGIDRAVQQMSRLGAALAQARKITKKCLVRADED